MPTTLTPPTAQPPVGSIAPGAESLAQSYDPPVRGPVLLGNDGFSATDATFRAAKAVAERLGTGVEVVGVLEPFPSYLTAPEIPILPPDVESARRETIHTAIERRLEAMGGGAEQWPILVVYGEPARTLAGVAREHESSMIVVGAGRREQRGRVVFGGDRALRVVRSANRPVLVVAPDFHELPKTVVVGIDFSPPSVRAARAALLLVGTEGRLVLVHVRPAIDLMPSPIPTIGSQSYDALVAVWRRQAEADAAQLFEHLREELRPYVPAGVTVETRTRGGAVLSQLLGVADDVGAEMIAVGTHGPGVVERFFLGSVATNALRASGRTVLVAPPPSPVEAARIDLRLRGTTTITRADEWEPALEAFSKRNAGRRVRLEVDDPELGAQVQQAGFALLGVSYDHHDRRIEIMLGDPADNTRHLTRTIAHADDVAFYAGPEERERALRIERGRGQTLFTFLD